MGSRPETRKERGFCEKSCLALALTEGRCRQHPWKEVWPWPDTGLSYNEAQMHLSSACGTGQGGHELRVARTGLDPIPLRRLTVLWGGCAEGQC